jgi:hypothetical protein
MNVGNLSDSIDRAVQRDRDNDLMLHLTGAKLTGRMEDMILERSIRNSVARKKPKEEARASAIAQRELDRNRARYARVVGLLFKGIMPEAGDLLWFVNAHSDYVWGKHGEISDALAIKSGAGQKLLNTDFLAAAWALYVLKAGRHLARWDDARHLIEGRQPKTDRGSQLARELAKEISDYRNSDWNSKDKILIRAPIEHENACRVEGRPKWGSAPSNTKLKHKDESPSEDNKNFCESDPRIRCLGRRHLRYYLWNILRIEEAWNSRHAAVESIGKSSIFRTLTKDGIRKIDGWSLATAARSGKGEYWWPALPAMTLENQSSESTDEYDLLQLVTCGEIPRALEEQAAEWPEGASPLHKPLSSAQFARPGQMD